MCYINNGQRNEENKSRDAKMTIDKAKAQRMAAFEAYALGYDIKLLYVLREV